MNRRLDVLSLIGWLAYAGLASFMYSVAWALGLFIDQVTACVTFIATAVMSIIVIINVDKKYFGGGA